MEFVAALVPDILKCGYNSIKALINLSRYAKRLETKIKDLGSTAKGIQIQLDRQGRNPIPVVKDWLDRQDKLIEFAEEALQDFDKIKKKRCGYCCPVWALPSSRKKILKCLADIKEELESASRFPQDENLGEIPTALTQHIDPYLVGIDEKLSNVEKVLLGDRRVYVIGVSGMGGVGKTTILKQINNNNNVRDSFKFVIWVKVSRNRHILDIQNEMCARLDVRLHSECVDQRAAQLREVLKKRGPLLLILDDVWTEIDVAELGVTRDLIGDSKVRILLSTRIKSVCEKMNADKTIEMKELTEDDGWKLFTKSAFGEPGVPGMDSEVQSLARSIAKECKGHPLALKTVARTMSRQDFEPEKLEYILSRLKTVNLNFYRNHTKLITDLFKPLKYSYDALPSDKLKICFLYLAAFIEGMEIDAQELTEIWRAEGLIDDNDEGRLDILKILDDRCLAEIETKEEKGVQICKVKIHDVLRDMAVQIGENDENSIFRVGNSLKSFPNCASTQLRRVSVMHNRIRSLPEKFDCSELLSLFLGWNQSLAEVPERFLENLSLLKTLDLSKTSIKSLPSSISHLKHLVYLRLSNTKIKVLPDEVFSLTSLQLLDLSFSPLKNLPFRISELKCLRILHLNHCERLEFVSSRISELTCLEELDMWEASFAFSREVNGAETENRMCSSRKASLQDVCNLHHLKRLQVSIKSSIVQGMMESLGEVRDLGLHLRDCDMRGTPDLFCTYENLKYLKLSCCPRLENLGGLGLGKLPNLSKLEIEKCPELKELGGEFGEKGNFPRLSYVKLRELSSLRSLFGDRVETRALSKLETLGIFHCKDLKRLPSGLDSVNLKIRGNAEWWNAIEWQLGMKERLQSKYVESMTD